jgi:aquaporin Z
LAGSFYFKNMSIVKSCIAEFIGTFWLVFGGCGSAVFAAAFPESSNTLGIGFVGVSLDFGLTVMRRNHWSVREP